MSRQASGRRKSLEQTASGGGKGRAQNTLEFEVSEVEHLADLCGGHDRHLAMIEQAFNVYVVPKGNCLTLEGGRQDVQRAHSVLKELTTRLTSGLTVGEAEVAAAIRMVVGADHEKGPVSTALERHQIRTRRKVISPRSPRQSAYIDALGTHDLVFGVGPAGTGKTYLAVAVGVAMLMRGEVDRLILSRPAVEAGENLGFLPGDMREKVDPYLRPLYDAMHDMMPGDQVSKRLENGDIEVAPLAFMRGRTLSNAFVILDEAQNCLPMQVKMFLTRLGDNSRMVITGDPSQVDLPTGPRGAVSGLTEALRILEGVEGIAKVTFTDADVVRHPLVARIIRAYNEREHG